MISAAGARCVALCYSKGDVTNIEKGDRGLAALASVACAYPDVTGVNNL